MGKSVSLDPRFFGPQGVGTGADNKHMYNENKKIAILKNIKEDGATVLLAFTIYLHYIKTCFSWFIAGAGVVGRQTEEEFVMIVKRPLPG